MFAQLSKCLYCIWPAIIIAIGWFLFRIINDKTYYGALPVGVDPLGPAGQAEFETTRQRDAEKRKIIYWCAGIIAAGYLIAYLGNTFILKNQSVKIPTPTIISTPTVVSIPAFGQTNKSERISYRNITNLQYPKVLTNKLIVHLISIFEKEKIPCLVW